MVTGYIYAAWTFDREVLFIWGVLPGAPSVAPVDKHGVKGMSISVSWDQMLPCVGEITACSVVAVCVVTS